MTTINEELLVNGVRQKLCDKGLSEYGTVAVEGVKENKNIHILVDGFKSNPENLTTVMDIIMSVLSPLNYKIVDNIKAAPNTFRISVRKQIPPTKREIVKNRILELLNNEDFDLIMGVLDESNLLHEYQVKPKRKPSYKWVTEIQYSTPAQNSGYFVVFKEGQEFINRDEIKSNATFWTSESGYSHNHPYDKAKAIAEAIAEGLNRYELRRANKK